MHKLQVLGPSHCTSLDTINGCTTQPEKCYLYTSDYTMPTNQYTTISLQVLTPSIVQMIGQPITSVCSSYCELFHKPKGFYNYL